MGKLCFLWLLLWYIAVPKPPFRKQTFRDYPYFRHVLIEGKAYTRIGGWLARKGENEIDIVAENELNAEAVFIEVKRKSQNFDSEALNNKIAVFSRATGRFKDYHIAQKGLSMDDM